MNFNHEKESITESFGIKVSSQKIADNVTEIIEQWLTSDDADKISVLGEKIHEQLPYEVILFLATQEVYGKVEQTFEEMENIIEKMIKSVGGNINDDRAQMN